MLFSEIYGAYFDAVSAILSEAAERPVTRARITEIVREKAFAESVLTVPRNLTDGTWPLLTADGRSVLKHKPELPATLLQKRWLKALLLDPRIRLFDISAEGLEDVEPLFTPEQFVVYDRYADGDPYTDEGYIARFRALAGAIREKRRVEITFDSLHGQHCVWKVVPYRLEYSGTDDKFRVITNAYRREINSINLQRITSVLPCGPDCPDARPEPVIAEETLTLELTDERNTLERAMLQLSYLTKETVRLDADHYRVTLHYRKEDENELLIRLLSFGPLIRVTAPDSFAARVRERIAKQRGLCRQPEK